MASLSKARGGVEVVAKDLIKVYRTGKTEVIALRGLNMHVKPGEVVAVMGPSGCGKTTLLNLIGGLDKPTAGAIFVGGRNLVDASERELERYRLLEVGFIFQFFNLVPTLTALENVELPMALAGRPDRRERAMELLELVGLADRAHHKPDELSGGEQQRVAIACALANDPPLILADLMKTPRRVTTCPSRIAPTSGETYAAAYRANGVSLFSVNTMRRYFFRVSGTSASSSDSIRLTSPLMRTTQPRYPYRSPAGLTAMSK